MADAISINNHYSHMSSPSQRKPVEMRSGLDCAPSDDGLGLEPRNLDFDRYEAVSVLLSVMEAAQDKGFSPQNSPVIYSDTCMTEARGPFSGTDDTSVGSVAYLAAWYQKNYGSRSQ